MAGEKYAAIWFGAKDENQTAAAKPEKILYGTNNKRDVLKFDKATDETGVWEPFLLPDFFDATKGITATVVCHSVPTTGNFILGFSLVGAADSEDEDPAVSFVAFGTEAIDGTSHDLAMVSKTVAYDAHGLAAGDFVFPTLTRDANNESDTLDDDLWVEGWGIKFEVTS
jgi:hypothetical protein